jgi:4-amino-4-deoxy-L-arabinose transferase-like glycosyltransferase
VSARRRPRDGGWIAGGVVFAIALTVLWIALPHQGLTDDDRFYAPAAMSYADWLGEIFTAPGDAFTKSRIDRAFKPNNEHPPFAKYVTGVTHAVTHKGLGIFASLDGTRAGVALLCALMLAFLVRLLWRPFGPGTAVLAALLTLSLPRLFFHSQVATLDVPVAAMVVITTAAFFWAERSRRWAWATGVIFGFALLTKLNAPFVAIPATLYALLGRWRGFGLGWGNERAMLRIPAIPRSLIAMAVIGPIVFFAAWPWLWFDTIKRLGAYLAFHLSHYPIYLFYEGEIFSKPFAPWHMPFTMAAGTTPAPVLLLGLVGVALALRALVRLVRNADAEGRLRRVSTRDQLLVLLLLQAFFAIGIVAFNPVPKYGGEKLFMPFFPLFCALAASGAALALEGAAALFPSLAPGLRWFRPLDGEATDLPPLPRAQRRGTALSTTIVCALALLLAVPGFAGTARFFGGYALSYYSEALGGLRGATARGYERTYYDIADKELARWLDVNARGEPIHFEPNHKEYVATYRWMQRDGYISRNVKLVGKRADAKVLVLTHERRWSTYPRLLDEHRGYTKIHEKRIDDVPLYTVYRRE